MKILKISLSLLLCTALCLPVWSVAVASESSLDAVSGTDVPSDGKELRAAPATPSDAGDDPLIPPVSGKLTEDGQQTGLMVIDRIFDPQQAVEQIPILKADSDFTAALPENVYGYYSRFGMVECPVIWDTSVPVRPGIHTFYGAVTAPDGYTLKPNAGLETVSIDVVLYRDEPVLFLPTIKNEGIYSYGVQLLPLGGDAEAVIPYHDLDMKSEQGYFIKAPVNWDLSTLDVNTVGRQMVYSMPLLPLGAAFIGEQEPVPLDIYVMEPDAVDLGAYNISGQTISCDWLAHIDLAQAVFEISEDGEHWLVATDMMPEEDIRIYNTHLIFSTASLELGKEYFFRLVYGGRCDGVLRVITAQDGILPPNWEGDRDGGDAGGSKPEDGDRGQMAPTPGNGLGSGSGNGSGTGNPGGREDSKDNTPPPTIITQTTAAPSAEPSSPQSEPPQQDTDPAEENKPAQPPQSPAQSNPASVPGVAAPAAGESDNFVELFGENRDLISGTRLLMMVDSGGQARFSKQGVTVSVSAEAVNRLGIQDSDRITVTIEKEGPDRFSFFLLVNDTPVTHLENTHVMVSYTLQTHVASLSLHDSEETEVAKGSYDAALAVASFTVNTTGHFAIVEEVVEEVAEGENVTGFSAPQHPEVPILPAVGFVAALLLTAGLGFLLKRRLHP